MAEHSACALLYDQFQESVKRNLGRDKELKLCGLCPHTRPGARAHPDLNQGPADLQSAALTTELCTHVVTMQKSALLFGSSYTFIARSGGLQGEQHTSSLLC